MQVSSRITINTAAINQLTELAKAALEQTAEALHTEVVQAQVVPQKDGTLQGEGMFVDYSMAKSGKVSIVHSTPYARRLYYHPEYNFHKEKWTDSKGREHDGNPNAGGEWFEPWMKGGKHGDFCNKAFAKFMRRLMK